MKIGDAGYGCGKGFWKHSHNDQWELHLFITGDGIFENNRKQFPITTGMLTYSRPYEQHHCICRRSVANFYYIGFVFESFDTALRQAVDDIFCRHSCLSLDEQTFSEFGRIIRKSKTENPNIIKSSEHLFSSLLYEIVAGNSRRYVAESDDLASSLLDELHNSTYKRVGLEEIAERMGYDKSYLIRIFKQKYKITPIKYLLKLKIDAACYLLSHSQLTIKEIAYNLKFYDEYYFSRKFKQFRDVSPRKYRLSSISENR